MPLPPGRARGGLRRSYAWGGGAGEQAEQSRSPAWGAGAVEQAEKSRSAEAIKLAQQARSRARRFLFNIYSGVNTE